MVYSVAFYGLSFRV